MPVALPFRATPAALFLVVLAVGACDDGPGAPPPPEPELATMRISVEGQVVDVSSTGVITGGPVSLTDNAAVVTVEFLESDGGPSVLVTADDFQVEAVSGATTTFVITRTGPFTFTFTGVATGSSTVGLALVHLEPNHTDFGPFNVPVEVNAGGNPN
jgi:hypothetical protein